MSALCERVRKPTPVNLFFIERYGAKDAVLTSPLGCGGARFHGRGKREKNDNGRQFKLRARADFRPRPEARGAWLSAGSLGGGTPRGNRRRLPGTSVPFHGTGRVRYHIW